MDVSNVSLNASYGWKEDPAAIVTSSVGANGHIVVYGDEGRGLQSTIPSIWNGPAVKCRGTLRNSPNAFMKMQLTLCSITQVMDAALVSILETGLFRRNTMFFSESSLPCNV